jgi:hypothetical protein
MNKSNKGCAICHNPIVFVARSSLVGILGNTKKTTRIIEVIT